MRILDEYMDITSWQRVEARLPGGWRSKIGQNAESYELEESMAYASSRGCGRRGSGKSYDHVVNSDDDAGFYQGSASPSHRENHSSRAMKRLPALAAMLLSSFIVGLSMFAAEPARVLIVVGPTTHPPGSHEVAAGGRLMKQCVEHMANVSNVKADVIYEWPGQALRDAASTVVFIGDIFPPNRLPNPAKNLAELDAMMKRGCGIVCVHYATGLSAGDVAEDGEHPLLHWMGGYFATRCKHHQSIARIYPAATITPSAPQHPVSRGWREFTVNDEPYINNYFGKDGNKPAPNVTVLAASMLPPEAPKREPVAWCVERPDGGRGFGIVMPHFYKNWRNDDLRRFILNGIVWTAKLEVPAGGVKTEAPDLKEFSPAAVEFVPPAPKAPKAKQ
jgi:type 1 glutamine amidotransferase